MNTKTRKRVPYTFCFGTTCAVPNCCVHIAIFVIILLIYYFLLCKYICLEIKDKVRFDTIEVDSVDDLISLSLYVTKLSFERT